MSAIMSARKRKPVEDLDDTNKKLKTVKPVKMAEEQEDEWAEEDDPRKKTIKTPLPKGAIAWCTYKPGWNGGHLMFQAPGSPDPIFPGTWKELHPGRMRVSLRGQLFNAYWTSISGQDGDMGHSYTWVTPEITVEVPVTIKGLSIDSFITVTLRDLFDGKVPWNKPSRIAIFPPVES